MGAWGHLFDENDDAADWLTEFADAPSWDAVDQALSVDRAEYLEAPEACQALAAAEIVAAGIGRTSPRLEGDVKEWASTGAEEAEARRELAKAALTQVRDDSELKELWQEADEYADWQASVNETLARL